MLNIYSCGSFAFGCETIVIQHRSFSLQSAEMIRLFGPQQQALRAGKKKLIQKKKNVNLVHLKLEKASGHVNE